ncbi:hypothetical protein [Paraburkholderia sp.]|uniref:hypothetical protein n=1 Tax=Paraburkholderia sp. TaxID=1926495 RepID=UPI003D6F6650
MNSGFSSFRFRLSIVAAFGALLAATPGSSVFAQSILAAPTPAGPLNSMAAAINNIGVKQCRSQLTALSTLGVQGTSTNDLLLDWDHKRVNTSPIFSLIGLEYPSNAAAAMSVTAVPEPDGSCSVSAERISVAPVACKTIAGQELQGYRATSLLGHMTVYTDGKDAGSSVSLIDSPPGCLVIRRYVAFSKAAAR